MADYWKSTPKYWCKFCQIFVRDTKFEKQQHEATGKHQGAIQRSLRTIHRDKEKEELDKQRAKDEVARLNGIASGAPSNATQSRSLPPPPPLRKATAQDAKEHLAQLAAMGIAIPDEYRGGMAMAGEWHTVKKTPAAPTIKSESETPVDSLSRGVRRKKADDEDEDELSRHVLSKKKAWGSAFKSVSDIETKEEDLNALFPAKPVKSEFEGNTTTMEQSIKAEDIKAEDIKAEDIKAEDIMAEDLKAESADEAVKAEPLDDNVPAIPPEPPQITKSNPAKYSEAGSEESSAATDIVFKKRKNKAAKTK